MGRKGWIVTGVALIGVGLVIVCWGVFFAIFVAQLPWLDGGAPEYHSAEQNAEKAAMVRRDQIRGWIIAGTGMAIAGAGMYTTCRRGIPKA